MIDGITARDSTIEIQRKNLATLLDKIDFLETCVKNQKYKISQLEAENEELTRK